MTRKMTSRDIDQDVGRTYTRITDTGPSILDLLAAPESEDVEFEPQPLAGGPIGSAKPGSSFPEPLED